MAHPPSTRPQRKLPVPWSLTRLALLALAAFTLQFISLAMISMALIVPLAMLFFMWWRIGTIEAGRRNILKDKDRPKSLFRRFAQQLSAIRASTDLRAVLIMAYLTAATALIVYGGPHAMYVVNVPKVIVFDGATAFYVIVVASVLGFSIMVSVSPVFLEFVAGKLKLKRRTDLEVIMVAGGAGALGGQYMLLVKLLAEVAEAAIFSQPENLSSGIIVALVIVGSALGIAQGYYWQRGMQLTRTSLFMPVYRLCFIASGVSAALVFLREFFDQSVGAIAAYTIGLAMDFAYLAYITRNALHERSKEDFSTIMFAEDEDLEHVIALRHQRRQFSTFHKYTTGRRRFPKTPSAAGRAASLRRANSDESHTSVYGTALGIAAHQQRLSRVPSEYVTAQELLVSPRARTPRASDDRLSNSITNTLTQQDATDFSPRTTSLTTDWRRRAPWEQAPLVSMQVARLTTLRRGTRARTRFIPNPRFWKGK
jgi:hypothetical protein